MLERRGPGPRGPREPDGECRPRDRRRPPGGTDEVLCGPARPDRPGRGGRGLVPRIGAEMGGGLAGRAREVPVPAPEGADSRHARDEAPDRTDQHDRVRGGVPAAAGGEPAAAGAGRAAVDSPDERGLRDGPGPEARRVAVPAPDRRGHPVPGLPAGSGAALRDRRGGREQHAQAEESIGLDGGDLFARNREEIEGAAEEVYEITGTRIRLATAPPPFGSLDKAFGVKSVGHEDDED